MDRVPVVTVGTGTLAALAVAVLLPVLFALLERPRVFSDADAGVTAGVLCCERPPRTLRCSVRSKSSDNSSSESKIAFFRRPLPSTTAPVLPFGVFFALLSVVFVSGVAVEAVRVDRALVWVWLWLWALLIISAAGVFAFEFSLFSAGPEDGVLSPFSFFTVPRGVDDAEAETEDVVGAGGTSGSASDSLSLTQLLNWSSLTSDSSSTTSVD